MLSSTFVVLALSATAFANVFVTSPTAATTFVAGKPNTVSWQDDGNQPTLKAFGPAIMAIYTGNAQQQTQLQTISPSIDVSSTQSVIFTPDPSIGPNGDDYFIRIQSISLKDATQPMYPALAFSAKFTMSGMTGSFNASVQSQVDGQSTAPIGGSATTGPSSSAPAATTPSTLTTAKASSASSSGSAAGGAAKTSAAAGASSTNSANQLAGASVAAFAGVTVAILSGVFC